MCNSTVTKVISLITAITLTGCASVNTYSQVKAEPIVVSADSKGIVPSGIVEDAMRIESTALFDDRTYKRIEEAAKSAKDIASAQKNIRDAVCDGTTPRARPKLTVHLVLNRPSKGEALDIIAKQNQILINQTAHYLKADWLDEGSRTDFIGKSYNPDFHQYHDELIETKMERKFASSRISVGVPFISGNTARDAERYFASAHTTPNLQSPKEKWAHEWFPSRSYLSMAFKNHYFVLSSKVSDMMVAVWGYERYGTEMKTEIDHDVQLTPTTTFMYFGMSDGFIFRNSAHYKPSVNSWKLEDGSIANPLVVSVLDDLAVLKSEFVLKIPKEDIRRLFGITRRDLLQYFGYEYDSEKFSASKALEHQGYIWSQILENQTEVSQSSQEDGSIMFEVAPSFEAFCKWAVPASSLIAQ